MNLYDYPSEREYMLRELLAREPFNTGTWQSMNVEGSRYHDTYELEDVILQTRQSIPGYHPGLVVNGTTDPVVLLQGIMKPDLPWAEDHFLERVSGVPHNPPPSASAWPHAVRGNADHTTGVSGQFDHTYPERFWPKFANTGATRPNGRQVFVPHNGIRFEYGDLDDVVDLLIRQPLTRQAYLPVWFPEDTGPAGAIRVPCTLGYHFMIRDGLMSCRYYLRSCDAVRHLHNDVYMAARLMQWVCDRVNESRAIGRTTPPLVHPGRLTVYIASLHAFRADRLKLERMTNVSPPRS